ncbi:MAG TPA: cytochrome c oxidase subunit II [Chloroflexota bacterium]|nr:cytochrome c oxidase subunit II [Chloroflexota bacterium]
MKSPRRPLLMACAGSLLLLSACGAPQSALNPRGPASSEIALLWWVLFWISVAVTVVVFGSLGWALFRPRHAPDATRTESPRLFLVLGVAIPSIILIGTFGLNMRTILATATPGSPPAVDLQIVGRQWWWEVRYVQPGPSFTTANELHIPVGQPVHLELLAPDVIHSFWVPELQKKTDMIPGQTNSTWIQADEPGDYRGQCAEYCGEQHGHMAFHVVAQPPDQFQAWLAAQQKPAAQPGPDQSRGVQVFSSAGCIGCHAIRYGSGAVGGGIGPDLTHLASRSTIAAGELANNRGNLGGWIVNSQAIKPGNYMPPIPISGDDLQALLDYLESLK